MKSILLLAATVVAGGCVQDDLTLTINRFVPPDPASMCTALPSSTIDRAHGRLDVGIVAASGSRGYITFPEVHNNLPMTMGTGGTTNFVELNAIDVTGVNVELIPTPDIAGAIPTALRKFSITRAGGRLLPQTSETFSAEILPREIALMLQGVVPTGSSAPMYPTVTARVSPVGNRSGNTIVGQSYDFPIEVCNFCMTTNPPPTCPGSGFAMSSVKLGGCFIQEDDPVTCCTDTQGLLLCGSDVPISSGTAGGTDGGV